MEESFIVRIFQRDGENPAGLVGLVEEVATGRQAPFHGTAELFAILGASPREGKAGGGSRPRTHEE